MQTEMEKLTQEATGTEEAPRALKKKSVYTPDIQPKRVRKLGDLFTGRRKTAVARVKIVKGTGKVVINSKELEQYFGRRDHRFVVRKPMVLTETAERYDFIVNVYGGGESAQAGAISLGIARGIDAVESDKHSVLRRAGLLTRDPRMVERKKFGLHKARRATQFSKR